MNHIKTADREQVMMISLDELVENEAMVRVIDRFIEIVDVEKLGFKRCEPAQTGRPPYPTKEMTKLYVYGYENGIKSSRKLQAETHRNIEVMWLMGNLKPDHKTISEFRRNNIRPLQKLFREFVKLCKSWELIGGKIIAFDGTKIKASNNKKMNFSRKKLNARISHLDEQIQKYLEEFEVTDESEGQENPKDSEGLNKLLKRKELYESYQKQLDETEENELSAVDPDARLMGNNRGGVDMAYNVQSAVDAKHHIIAEYDVSKNPSDQNQLSSMVKKLKRKLKLRRFMAVADKGYYNGADLLRVKKNGVKAIVSRQKPSDSKEISPKYYSEKFTYDKKSDTYTCPAGNVFTTNNKKGIKRRKFTNKEACKKCEHFLKCNKSDSEFRTITRGFYGDIYDEADALFAENIEIYRLRQQIVEHPFGTIKHTMHGGYFLLRTRRKVCAEVALLFLGYNLKRVLKVLGFAGFMARLDRLYAAFWHILAVFTENLNIMSTNTLPKPQF